MPRNTLEAYGDIVATLYLAHNGKPFPRSELMNLFLQEMNIFHDSTGAAHLKTMITLDYIGLSNVGTAYKQTTYHLGPKGLAIAKKVSAEAI